MCITIWWCASDPAGLHPYIYIYIYVHVYLLNAAACMSACMGTLNLLSRVTASTSTIIRRTTYVMRVLQCARASSMQTSKQSLHEVTSGTANHCVEDNSQVSIKHRIYMLTAGIKRCASCLNWVWTSLIWRQNGMPSLLMASNFILALHACNLAFRVAYCSSGICVGWTQAYRDLSWTSTGHNSQLQVTDSLQPRDAAYIVSAQHLLNPTVQDNTWCHLLYTTESLH